MRWVLSLTIFLVFVFILILVLVLLRSNEKEGWEDYVDKVYRKYLLRPVDIVFEHYYRDKDMSFIRNDLREYIYQVKQGRQHAETQSIAVAGLLRDCEEILPHLQAWYRQLKSRFKETMLIVVENDSKDGTRARLLEWHATDPSVVVLCASEGVRPNAEECATGNVFAKEYSKTPSHVRIEKMAHLRNVYLDYLQSMENKVDSILVMDLDLQGEFFVDGLFHSVACMVQDPSLDAVACNGMMMAPCSISATNLTYYDSFAYVAPGEEGEWNTLFDKRSHDDEVIRYTSEKYLRGTMALDPVVSAFGGACLYRASSLRGARYGYSEEQRYVCEHTRLHRHLSKMVVNPRMLFVIERNLR